MSKLLTTVEVAERLRVSPWTVRDLTRRGRLTAVKLVRGKLLFREQDVEQAVEAARQQSVTPAATAG